MKDFSLFIDSLQESISAGLPGVTAQQIMAPSERNHTHKWKMVNTIRRQSAVMIMLYPHNNDIYFACIKRPEYDGPHSGQVSLPGGKFDLTDTSLQETAQRETYEEIGVEVAPEEVIGGLTDLYIPVSNMDVYPFVSFKKSRPEFLPDKVEVSYIIEISLREFCQSNSINSEIRVFGSNEINVPYFLLANEKIWGATAMILSEFSDLVNQVVGCESGRLKNVEAK